MHIRLAKIMLLAGFALAGICLSAKAAAPAGYNWNLVMADEFSSFNPNMWGYGGTPWGTQTNSRCTIIPAQDTYVENGNYLVLRSRQGTFYNQDWSIGFPYTSGYAWTRQWLTYGYIEIAARYPNNRGAWPAFWMLRLGWPPEFDVAEFRGSPKNYMTHAWADVNQNWGGTSTTGDFTFWRTYGVDWEPNYIAFYQDNTPIYTFTGSTVPSTAMYAILSAGTECTDTDGTGFPNDYDVDYFRWYQRTGTGAIADGYSGVGGYYSLRNRATGRCLDNLGSTADGAIMGLWTPGGSPNQQWIVSTVSGGYRRLQCRTGGKLLDNLGNTANGGKVGQWSSVTSSYNQQWTFEHVGGFYYKIKNRASGKYLDSLGGTSDGSQVGLWSSSGSYNQQWEIITPYYDIQTVH